MLVEEANPDRALRSNDVVKNPLRPLNRQRLPGRKIRVSSQSRAVPNAHHFSLVGILKRSNAAAYMSDAGVVHDKISCLMPHTMSRWRGAYADVCAEQRTTNTHVP